MSLPTKAINQASDRTEEIKDIVNKIRSLELKVQDLSEEQKESEEIVKALIDIDVENLEKLPALIRNNKEIVKYAIRRSKKGLSYASEELRSDEQVVDFAVGLNGWAISFASAQLKANKKLVIKAMKKDGAAFECLDQSMRSDKEVVLAALQSNRKVLKYVGSRLQNDKEIIRAAIIKPGEFDMANNFEFASNELKDDEDFVKEFLMKSIDVFRFASERVCSKKEIAMLAAGISSWAISYASAQLRADEEFVMASVKKNGGTLKSADSSLKDKEEFVLAAIKNSPSAFEFASERIKKNMSMWMSKERGGYKNKNVLQEMDNCLKYFIEEKRAKKEKEELEHTVVQKMGKKNESDSNNVISSQGNIKYKKVGHRL